jgi:outer membrane protein assembly factor BamB
MTGVVRRTLSGLLLLALLLVFVAFLPAAARAVAPALTNADRVVAFQIDPAHTGQQPTDSLRPPLVRKWAIDLPAPATNPVMSYPLIVDGRIFVTEFAFGGPGRLYALSERTGGVLWGPVSIGGDGHYSALAFDSGRIFTISSDGLVDAFDPHDGRLLWSTPLGSPVDSAVTAAGGVVYVTTNVTLVALSESTGGLLWTRSVEWADTTDPAVAGGAVYTSRGGVHVYGFGLDGTQLWHRSGPAEGGGGSNPAVYRGHVYARGAPYPAVVLDAATGGELGGFDSDRIPAFWGSTGYFTTTSFLTTTQQLRAVDLGTGATLWTFDGDGSPFSAPIVAGPYVYIGTWNGVIYALDAQTGALAWSGNVGANINPPDEHNAGAPLTGFSVADGLLLVPVFHQGPGQPFELVAYRPAAGTATVNAQSVDFGSRVTGSTSAAARVKVTDTGAGTLAIGAALLGGAAALDYAVSVDGCSNRVLAPDQSCQLSLTFRPTQQGTRNASLTLPTGDSVGARVLALEGTGSVAPPTITGVSPASGRIGSTVTISGTNLSGASSVTLRYVPAAFTVISATRITATVPATGAGDGRWRTTTGGGTATSPSAFYTTP